MRPTPATTASAPPITGAAGFLLLAFAIPPALAACPDDFSGPSLAAPWSFVDADGAAGGSYALAGGKLELVGRGRDAFKEVNEFVGVMRSDIAGDFDVSVKLESQVNTHGWAQAGILAAHDLSDLSQGGYVVLDVSPGNGYTFFQDAAAPAGSLDRFSQADAAPAYPSWIRLAKSGAKFSAWYRTKEDRPWTPIGGAVTPQGAQAPSRIALVSLSHDQSKDGKAVFDDFTCLHLPTLAIGPRAARNRAVSPGIALESFSLTGRRVMGPGFFLRP